MSSEYFVKLDRFEGPLDLLLHLIKVHEIDIFAIDIFKLTTEYLGYLRLVKFDDISEAGEFVAMGATLIEIKSRSLLPTEDRKVLNEDGIEEDPLKTLQDRLMQYEMIRKAAEWLSQSPQMGVEIQTNHEHERLAEVFKDVETPLEGDPARLIILFDQIMRDLADRKAAKIEAKTHGITLEQTIERFDEYIQTVRFGMFQGLYNKFRSRYDMVVHLMAVLELSKQQKLRVFQQDMMGPLWFYRGDLDQSILPVASATPMHDSTTDAEVVDVPVAVQETTEDAGKYMIAEVPSGSLMDANSALAADADNIETTTEMIPEITTETTSSSGSMLEVDP
jgi:segregation and condensation protein A